MAHTLTNMIRDVNNFISDSNRSIKKTLNFTVNEQPSTAYILGAVTVGVIGAMIYRSNGTGIEVAASTVNESIPEFLPNEQAVNEVAMETPLLDAPSENSLLPQPVEDSPPVDIFEMDNSPENTSVPLSESALDTPIEPPIAPPVADQSKPDKQTQIPSDYDLL